MPKFELVERGFCCVILNVGRETMNTISGIINENYGWEVTVFHKLREASDGVIFFDGKINWDRYIADHSPRFEIHLVMLNYTIIEISVYYLHHRDAGE